MTVDGDRLPVFYHFLERGFVVQARTGIAVRDFVCRELGIAPAYLDGRIQTVFLDARAVDDVNATLVGDGATLALSAAMPGLVGATLRRGGHLAAFRRGISADAGPKPTSTEGRGFVTVKLFNLLTQELGPDLLAAGIRIGSRTAARFFADRGERFWAGCRRIQLDGTTIDRQKLLEMEWGDGDVLLKATPAAS